jgi:nucleotide-binding universal stress UspA family protein
MKEFKNILFPVDLSESSEKIVPYVQTVADKFESQLHLLFVARVFEHLNIIYVPHWSISQFEKEIITGAERRLYEFDRVVKTAPVPVLIINPYKVG